MLQNLCAVQIAEPEGYGKKGSIKQGRAAFADGTALPAKRPRSSNTADPDAMRSNKRVPAITDFFNNITKDKDMSNSSKAVECTHNSRVASGRGREPQSSDIAVTDVSSHSPVTSDPQGLHATSAATLHTNETGQVSKPTIAASGGPDRSYHGASSGATVSKPDMPLPADSMRRIMADAAMRRRDTAQEGACHSQVDDDESCDVGHPPAQPSALSSIGRHAGIPSTGLDSHAKSGDIAHVTAVIDLVDDNSQECKMQPAMLKKPSSAQGASSSQVSCPICGHMWSSETPTSEIHKHVDACLSMQLL